MLNSADDLTGANPEHMEIHRELIRFWNTVRRSDTGICYVCTY